MIKIGVLCPSEIAFRRFMPALMKLNNISYVGIASATKEEWFGEKQENDLSIITKEKEKALNFKATYGGKVFGSYEELLNSSEIDAIYIPLPPALHYKWAKEAILHGKHVLVEKPSTTRYYDTKELVELSKERKVALHENYMFIFHSQLEFIETEILNKTIGDVRLYRINFGFPFRGKNDFRYMKELGGGALLDCGGYTIKLASKLLGKGAKIVASQLNYIEDFDVDIYGSATINNEQGQVAQISFGMDNSYKCELEVWGSTGIIYTNRILTAPDGYEPIVEIKKDNEMKTVKLATDDSFKKSIFYFTECILNEEKRKENFENILNQSYMVEQMNRSKK